MFEIDGITQDDQRVVYDVSRDMFEDILNTDEDLLHSTAQEAMAHPDAEILRNLFIDQAQFPEPHVNVLQQVALEDARDLVGMQNITPEDFV